MKELPFFSLLSFPSSVFRSSFETWCTCPVQEVLPVFANRSEEGHHFSRITLLGIRLFKCQSWPRIRKLLLGRYYKSVLLFFFMSLPVFLLFLFHWGIAELCEKLLLRKMRPIFCGNFEYDARPSELERLFRRYGKVDKVDMKSGKCLVSAACMTTTSILFASFYCFCGCSPFLVTQSNWWIWQAWMFSVMNAWQFQSGHHLSIHISIGLVVSLVCR